MNIADELRKLEELHRSGALADEEFVRAKSAVLGGAEQQPPVMPPLQVPPRQTLEQETRQWAMFIHLSQLASLVVPLAGVVLAIVLWQIKKNELPGVDVHGKIVVNWILTKVLYMIGSVVLVLCLIGIPVLIALVIAGIVFPIIGAIKANNGEAWDYPMSIQFLK